MEIEKIELSDNEMENLPGHLQKRVDSIAQ